VASRRPAEQLSVAKLEPFWFGIDKERHFFTYHRCVGCGLLYNRTFFSEAQLGKLYAAMPPNMDQVPDDAIIATQRGYFAAAAAREVFAGDYLEIGPDVGHLVGEAARAGTFERFWLFEPNHGVHPRLRDALGSASGQILPSMTDLSAVPDGVVGLAVMVHVLDHLLDPSAMLTEIRAKLRPGGTLMIVTHDERSALSRMLGPKWPAFCLQHPELYNPVTIERLLTNTGFASVEVKRSTNHFPIDFLARQLSQAAGVRALGQLPLPRRSIGLRLGNMLTFARARDQAAVERRSRLESAA
jgi:SAM-dependent methyltransferase